MKAKFRFYTSNELMSHVGAIVKYVDLFGKERESVLEGNGKRVWLKDVACNPFADTVLLNLEIVDHD